MGDIYRVSGTPVGFPVIMKVPRLGDEQSIEGLLAFETEVMILPTLSGAHFPRFVRAGDVTENPYLVLEWLDGRSVAQHPESGPIPPAEAVRVGAGIADALQSLHLQNTIHFDLKPDNAIVRPDGRVCLIDFGLASRPLSGSAGRGATLHRGIDAVRLAGTGSAVTLRPAQ